jgi:hypothetical protein
MMASMATVIQKISRRGDTATMDELIGLQNMAAHLGENIQLLSQDPNEKQRVRVYGDQLGKMMNLVKQFAQALQEKMQSQNGGMGQQDQETLAKIESMKKLTEAKAANTRESHAQRTIQRQIQFERQLEQDAKKAELDLRRMHAESTIKLSETQRKAQIELEKERLKLQRGGAPGGGGVE